MKWTEFDPATGRILQSIEGVQLNQPATSGSRGIVDGVLGDGASEYVSAGALATRPATTVTLSQAGAVVTLSNIALGVVVVVSGNAQLSITQDATDGQMVLTFTTAGDYIIDCEQIPQLPFQATITV
jgi:hypothetical protein